LHPETRPKRFLAPQQKTGAKPVFSWFAEASRSYFFPDLSVFGAMIPPAAGGSGFFGCFGFLASLFPRT